MAKPLFSTVLGLTMALTAPPTALTSPSFSLEKDGEQESGLLDTLSKPPSYFSEEPDSEEPEDQTTAEEEIPKVTVTPGKPTGLVAAANGNSVFLAWNNSSTNSDITGYEYRQKVLSESYGEWSPMGGWPGIRTSYPVMYLDYGTTYEFQIRAVSYEVEGTPSTAVSVTTPGTPAPSQPAAPTNFEVSPQFIPGDYHYVPELIWTLVDSNRHISGYELRLLEEDQVFKDWEVLILDHGIPPGTGSVTLTDDLLLPNQDYTFQLRAFTSTAKGKIAEVTANYPPQQLLAPAPVSAEIIDRDVKLSWTDYTNGVAPYKYEYRMKETGGSFGSWINIENSFPDGTTLVDNGITILTYSTIIENLEPGTIYAFEVRASLDNLFHVGYPWSPSASIRTPGPSAPVDLEVYKRQSPDGYHYWPYLRWELIESNSDISGYELRVLKGTKIFKDWKVLAISSTAPVGMGITNVLDSYLLLPSQDYTFQLRAITPTVKGRISEVSVNYPPQQPSSPSPVSAKIVDGDIKLSWADYTNGVAPYKYEYRMKETGGSFGSWINIENSFPDSATPWLYKITILTHGATIEDLIEDLEPDTTYTFEMRTSLGSLFHVGYPNSPSASITTPSQPAAPADLKLWENHHGNGYHYLPKLSWTLVNSNSEISGYELRVLEGTKVFKDWNSLTLLPTLTSGMAVTNVLTDYLLLPNQDYTFQLRAVTPTIKGLISEVSINYPSRQPLPPEPVSAKIVGERVRVLWEDSSVEVVGENVKLSWGDPSNGVAPYKYEYRMKEAGGSFGSWINIENSFPDGTTPSTDPGITVLTYSTTIDNLGLDTTYTFEVRASLGSLLHAGYPHSPSTSITTSASTAP